MTNDDKQLKNHFKKKEIFTIPNVLTYLRILLIPLFIYLYCFKAMYTEAIILAVFIELTDLADGWIARHFNMVSDIGKTLDPFADKLMQASFVVALAFIYPSAWILFAFMFVKEILLGILALRAVKIAGVVSGSKWYGRLGTWIIDVSMAVLLLWNTIPEHIANIIFAVNGVIMLFCLFMYAIYYEGIVRKAKKDDEVVDKLEEYANKQFEVPKFENLGNPEKREAMKDVRHEYREAKKELRQEKKSKTEEIRKK
ncbi:MAG: CDP-alcohol phosphatidyltransferase family protein [Clostridia bacterium]|nr:CDP-alcohol phosphatidyltransferase family protein [Clostridia bacterium]